MKGVRRAIELFEDRNVPGDQIGAIFYDGTLEWNRVITLRDDNFDYMTQIFDTDDMENTVNFDNGVANGGVLPGGSTPLWIKLGLFPKNIVTDLSTRGTNIVPAFSEAVSQFAQSGAVGSKFFAHFSDGEVTCSPDFEQPCHSGDFARYRAVSYTHLTLPTICSV